MEHVLPKFLEYAIIPTIAIIAIFIIKESFTKPNETDFGVDAIPNLLEDLIFNVSFCQIFFCFSIVNSRSLLELNKISLPEEKFTFWALITSFIFFFISLFIVFLNKKKINKHPVIVTLIALCFTSSIHCIAIIGGTNLIYYNVFLVDFWSSFLVVIANILFISLLFIIYKKITLEIVKPKLLNKYIEAYQSSHNKSINSVEKFEQIIRNAKKNDPILINTYYYLSKEHIKSNPPNFKRSIESLNSLIILLEDKSFNREELLVFRAYVEKMELLSEMGEKHESLLLKNFIKQKFANFSYCQSYFNKH